LITSIVDTVLLLLLYLLLEVCIIR